MNGLKMGVMASVWMMSVAASAGVVDLEPTADTLLASTVERVIVLQKETSDQPAIRVVRVDNGGSSDISSLMAPSRLYVGIHADGEMFDVNGNYLIADAVVEITSAKYNSKTKVVDVEFTSKDDRLKTKKSRVLVYLADSLKEAASAESDSDDVQLKSVIGLQRIDL